VRLEVGDVIVLPGGSPHVMCCDVRPFNPLLAALPRTMVVSDRSGADGWLAIGDRRG
jgi:hypothetical protein